MKTTSSRYSVGALLLIAAVGVDAISLHKRQDGPPRVVRFELERNHVSNPRERDRVRRGESTVQVDMSNMQTLYTANASLGTPGQQVRLQVDTGSSDLWVNTDESEYCQSNQDPCSSSGTYDSNSSSTYEFVGSYFNISYADGSSAAGDYATDKLSIGGAKFDKFQFGIGYESSAGQNILGIGYPVLEAQVQNAGMDPYRNLPAAMVEQGLIQSQAFSLYLNSLDASKGSVLFGGVDTRHFQGDLSTMPIQTTSSSPTQFFITLTGVSLGSTDLSSDAAIAVLLDSGSSLTYLPNDMIEQVYEMVQADYQQSQGVAIVSCDLAKQDTNMTFTFSGPQISVPMSELVLGQGQVTNDPGNGHKKRQFGDGGSGSSGQECLFGLAPAGQSTVVLGDTFLRSAYVVYDLDNSEISLAQTDFSATGSNVVEISNGSSGVPQASGVATPVAATAGAGGGQIPGGTPNDENGAAVGKERGAMAGAVVGMAGVAVGFALCLA